MARFFVQLAWNTLFPEENAKIWGRVFSGLLTAEAVQFFMAVRGYGVSAGEPRQVRKEATVTRPALP